MKLRIQNALRKVMILLYLSSPGMIIAISSHAGLFKKMTYCVAMVMTLGCGKN
jgi:hypothetical protein